MWNSFVGTSKKRAALMPEPPASPLSAHGTIVMEYRISMYGFTVSTTDSSTFTV